MHHFIYPSQDTFITNTTDFANLNFGLDETLRVGTKQSTVQIVSPTTSFAISQSVANLCVVGFSGSIFSASLYGTASFVQATIFGNSAVTSSFFNGTLTGSYSSASVTGSAFTGTLANFSGSLTGSISGSVSGSFLTTFIQYFNGVTIGYTGKIITGSIVGYDILPQQNTVITTVLNTNRALVQFDITAVSASVATGDIPNPTFRLKLKVAREEELPIQYSVYAFPISESWGMGDGYISDGGSVNGASWLYRNFQGGTTWSMSGSTHLNSPVITQSFNYQVGDINMDVTPIVMGWISGTFANNGILLISSDEFSPTGSGMSLYFFSKDTNTIYSPLLDVGWGDFSWQTGSVFTASVNTFITPQGYIGQFTQAAITGSHITGAFTGLGNFTFDPITSASVGAISVNGLTGSIQGLPIFGDFSGSVTSSQTISQFPQPTVLSGVLLDGIFSGSQFTSSFNGFILTYGYLTGSWTSQSLIGNQISASYPSSISPSFVVTITGPYINGTALGTFNVSSSLSSASFDGVFTTGLFSGAKIDAQISGTFLTASLISSSVVMATSSLTPVEFNEQFVTVIQNVPPVIKAGNVIRVDVFARQEFPLKNFNRQTQFSQFLIPQYLPTSSFYSIKDNETEEIILDFDNYTQLSCDTNGNFFMLDTTGLPQERYFKILIKTEQSGSIYTFDRNDIFKIVR